MNEPAIRTNDLTKLYGGIAAVSELNLNVPRGSIYGFLGRNGAGKTTTIKMLLNLVRPSAGSARVLGLDVRNDCLSIFEHTAFVCEKKTLYSSLTPSELVQFNRGFYRKWSDTAVKKYAELFEIPMKQKFGRLSNGNQTKVWLLLALAQRADLLIMDEPTSALDPVTVDQFLRVLAEESSAHGCSVFFSSHQLEQVEQIAEHVGIIDSGKLLLESRLDDIKTTFRLITAAGNGLPTKTSSQVLSVEVYGNFFRYLVTIDADQFATKLSNDGATITGVEPLGLREIFLRLIVKGQPCIAGNAGGTLGYSS